MEIQSGSIEWYAQNLPFGVTINEDLSYSYNELCLDIDTVEYPTLLSQMGIINYIELALVQPGLRVNYSLDKFQYVTAYKFRKEHGYDNTFFEPVEAKHFGKPIEEICTVIPKEDEK